MKKKILFICLVSVFSICLGADEVSIPELDEYSVEQQGYMSGIQITSVGVLYTDNYASSLYLRTFDGSNKLLASGPGCGRYVSVSKDGNRIGFKKIHSSSLQEAIVLDLITGKERSLCSPSSKVGQPTFDASGNVYFTLENVLHIQEGPLRRTLPMSTYYNYIKVSGDGKYVAYANELDQLEMMRLSNGSILVLDRDQAIAYPKWSPESDKILYTTMDGNLFQWDLTTKKKYSLGFGSEATWTDNNNVIFSKRVIKDMNFVGSDLFISSADGFSQQNITNSPDVFEMNPVVKNQEVYYHTYNNVGIEKAGVLVKNNKSSLENIQVVYSPEGGIDIHFHPMKNDLKQKSIELIPNVPYIHQVFDTPSSFDGKGACGATTSNVLFAYYNLLPPWPDMVDHGHSFDPHLSNYGRYIARKYRFNENYYDIWKSAYGTDSWGGYAHTWTNGTPSSRMQGYMEDHGLVCTKKWGAQAPFSYLKSEVDANHPFPICTFLTSSGHIFVVTGYIDGSKIVICNDVFGNRNTPDWPSYDGKDTYYDWPGYNNGYQNLDPTGNNGGLAWTISGHGQYKTYDNLVVDDLDFNNGFYVNNSINGSAQRYYRDQKDGYKGHMWWTYSEVGNSDICFVEWKPTIPQNGLYKVSAYINTLADAEAVYRVTHDGGTSIVEIDQSQYNDQWVVLGTYGFSTNSSTPKVYLGDSSGVSLKKLGIDAMRWEFEQITADSKTESIFDNVTIFPNPTSDYVYISGLDVYELDAFSVRDVQGRNVSVEINSNGSNVIFDFTKQSIGSYFIHYKDQMTSVIIE